MWDKRKGKTNMHKEFDFLWYGSYNIVKNTKFGSFYLSIYLREGNCHYQLVDPFSSPIMRKEPDFLGLE
jgi:hypothetical protein